MGCGCKKPKQEQPVQPPVNMRLTEVQNPVVTQPAPQSNNR